MRRAELARDVAICHSMAADLNAYLLKDILYWRLSDAGPHSRPYPQLTLGGLLMRLHHLEILQQQLSPENYETYQQAHNHSEEMFTSWRVHLERKMLAEIAARMRPWSFFLMDCAESTQACAEEYPTQAEVRTMLALLLEKAHGIKGSGKLLGQLGGLDRRLQDLTVPGPFVWDALFESAYPADTFWWLYVKPGRRF